MNTHAPEQQATALPWFTGDDHPSVCVMRDGESIQICAIDTAPFAVGEPEANAALIVHTVNRHEALVEALRLARQYVAGAYECAFPDEAENESILKQVDVALALAEGREK